ncbi:hypothetical protein ACWGIB_19775 [Streptomyces xiamenensis]
MTPRTTASRRRPALAVAAGAGALLAVSAALGRYVRPTSDDWCAAWKTRELGIHGITWDFYTTQNGRVANAFLNGVTYTAGLLGPKLLPAFLLLTLATGLVVLGRTLAVRTGREAPLPALIAAALVLPALLVYASPLPYQTLLWAPATISHTLPAIIGLWLVVWALWAQRRGKRARRAAVLGVLAAGVFLGTLSEAFSAVAAVLAGLAGLAALAVVAALRLGYGEGGWTYYRTWNSFLLPLLLALCCYGMLAGQALATRLRPRARTVAALLTTAATLGALAGLLPDVRSLATETRDRAAAWDAQDTRIRTEAAAGATAVGYQPLHIAGLTEPFMAKTGQGDWAARCVAGFYQVDRIEPIEPRGGATP